MYGDTSDTGGTDPDPEDPDPEDPDPGPTGACEVTYTITNQWPDGFQADVKLTNTGSSTWNGWSLDWSFADGQKISQLWNASHTQSGAAVSVRNTGWNGTVAAGSSAAFGFTATRSAANSEPTTFQVGGETCTVG